jgi:hypothetical protein
MPQCQFPFSAIFVFQKSYIGNILRIGGNEAQNSYFPDTRRSPKQRRRRARRQPHPLVARPWLRQGVVWAPWPPSDIALLPIKSLRRKNPKSIGAIQEKFRSAAAIEEQFQGTKFSVPALCRDGKLSPEPSPSMLLTPMMRRE